MSEWVSEWVSEWMPHACMHEWMNEWMNEWMHACMTDWTNELTNERTSKLNEWMNEWMNGWMIEWSNDGRSDGLTVSGSFEKSLKSGSEGFQCNGCKILNLPGCRYKRYGNRCHSLNAQSFMMVRIGVRENKRSCESDKMWSEVMWCEVKWFNWKINDTKYLRANT